MKYFLDTEFLEGPQKKTFCGISFGYTKPTIDLISIGIVAEDGREYYAISKDFNLKEAWNRYDLTPEVNDGSYKKVYWLRENVLKPIWREMFFWQVCDSTLVTEEQGKGVKAILDNGEYDSYFTLKGFAALLKIWGKSNKRIADQIITFSRHPNNLSYKVTSPEFYAYFADYDWVVFCWLFGKMMDLPAAFPMYCKDLKQDFDFYNENFKKRKELRFLPKGFPDIEDYKEHVNYPKQDPAKSHNALEDARWNKKLYDFLNQL